MAFALLANLPPVNGLYSSFFPLLIYFFLGGIHQMVPGKTTSLLIPLTLTMARTRGKGRFRWFAMGILLERVLEVLEGQLLSQPQVLGNLAETMELLQAYSASTTCSFSLSCKGLNRCQQVTSLKKRAGLWFRLSIHYWVQWGWGLAAPC